MNKAMPKPLPTKSLNEQFTEGMIFVVIGSFLLYLVGRFFEFMFSPFVGVSSSPEETEERIKLKIKEKQDARERRANRFSRDVNDPIVQFQHRFVEHAETYADAPDNEIYKEWFMQWKAGNIIDTELRWAPRVYESYNVMSKNFIDYMKIQWDLHKKDSPLKRGMFCRTINRYFPEFTPTMKGLEEDLAQYEAEITESLLKDELNSEIQKFGLPPEAATYLMEVPAEELQEKASAIKEYIEKGFSINASIFGVERGLPAPVVEVIHEVIENTGLPAEVGYAFVKKEIDIDDIKHLVNQMEFVLESYEEDAFKLIAGTNETPYDKFLNLYLQELKGKNVAKRLCEDG